MFLRICKADTKTEILFNTDNIGKIEVSYHDINQDNNLYKTLLRSGISVNDNIVKIYDVYFGNEKITLINNPNDKIVGIIEDIYNNSIKN